MNPYEEPTSNITEFLRNTLKIDKLKRLKEFIDSTNEVDYKFEPTTTDLPDEIQFQCPLISAAVFYNAVKCFDLLAESGAKLTAHDSWLCTLLHQAARLGRIHIFTNPHCENLNFASCDWRGRQPIHYAAEFNHLECVKFLVENKNIDINSVDKFGMTPLHVACEVGNIETIHYLVEQSAEMKQDKLGRTPLELAAVKGQIEVLRAFASKNSSLLLAKNDQNRNLAHFAALSGFPEEIEFLTTIPEIDFNQIDTFGMAPIHYAAEHNYANAVHSLLAANSINRDIRSKPYDNSPLHIAAEYGANEAVEALISSDAQINNVANVENQSALHLAAQNGHGIVVQTLMNAGLDPNLIDRNGRSPREMAHGCYAENIIKCLNGQKQNFSNIRQPEPYPRPTNPTVLEQHQQTTSICQIA